MGLSICRSIIDAHGGRLWAEANEPRGAVFQFTLSSINSQSRHLTTEQTSPVMQCDVDDNKVHLDPR